ncbi:TOMM precursor leader peptide-binding protein [Streptomyces sp. 8N114]|uniref:TOMM precursor leader peptide-binding protein n=1 Tax=Streptomyces sp. 8N114 TaxID=3457419 RepID=UPI003FD239F8
MADLRAADHRRTGGELSTMPNGDVLTAEQTGAAALRDPQLSVPALPRLRRGVAVRPVSEGLVVEGLPSPQVFRGKAATALLPRLLPLLDGGKDCEALAEELGMAPRAVFKALSLLWMCGVIEDSPPPGGEQADAGAALAAELADYLSRMGDSTGANSCWEQGALRLATARVAVFGTGPTASALAEELAPSAEVIRLAGTEGVPPAGTTLAVTADLPPGELSAVAADCRERNIPLVRVAVFDGRARLGPFVHPRYTPCLDCLLAEDAGTDAARTEAADSTETDEESAALTAALAAHDLFGFLSRSVPSPYPNQWRTVALDDLRQRRHSGATRPGCPTCSASSAAPEGAEGPEPAPLAARYEAFIGFPPHEYLDLKGHQQHYKPSNLALQRQEKTWPVCPQVDLPAPDTARLAGQPYGHEEPARDAAVDLDTLSLVLATVAGIRAGDPDFLRRWTPSGGNIGSVLAHVAVRDADGLEPGIYGYVPGGHRLALLAPGTAVLDGIPGRGPATLVLTGNLGKVAKKYHSFALRVTLLDAGCAQATLRRACRTLGLPRTPVRRWDERAVTGALGVDPRVEPVTAVTDLGRPL